MASTATADPRHADDPRELADVPGPSAFGGSRRRFLDLLLLSTKTQIKLRYRGSLLGYAWTLIRPLALFSILYLVFTRVIRLGGSVEDYAIVLLLGIVLFTFFSEATSGGLTSLVASEATIRRTQFPRIVVTLAPVAIATFTLLMNLIAVAVFIILTGVEPEWGWLLFPIVLVLLVVFTTGVSLGLAAFYVRFRDVSQAWAVASRALFYATPILYPVEFVPDGLKFMLALNPLAPLIAQARVWVVDPDAPGAVDAVGGVLPLIGTSVIFGAVAVGGLLYFARVAPRAAEEL